MNNKIDENEMPIVEKAKDWPDNNETVMFSDIVEPLREALQVALDKGDEVYKDGIEWNGFNGLRNGRHPCIPNIPETLHAVGLQYHKERDRDAFTTILSTAVQLGMEQGKREIKEELQRYKSMFFSETGKKMIESIIKS